jgi:cAMP phosphodiesterase
MCYTFYLKVSNDIGQYKKGIYKVQQPHSIFNLDHSIDTHRLFLFSEKVWRQGPTDEVMIIKNRSGVINGSVMSEEEIKEFMWTTLQA